MKNLTNAVKAASVFSAKNDVRYYFNGVTLYMSGGDVNSIVSTDSHVCAIIGDFGLKGVPVVIDNKDVDTLCNALLASDDVELGDGVLIVGAYHIPVVDCRFPDIKRLIPNKSRTPCELVGIKIDYMAKLKPFKNQLYKHLPAKEKSCLSAKMSVGGETDVITLTFSGEEITPAIVLISPMRLQ